MAQTLSNEPTILIVPGLRDQVAQHWQTLLEERVRAVGQAVVSVAAAIGPQRPAACAFDSRVSHLPGIGYGEWPHAVSCLIEQRAAPAVSLSGGRVL